MIIWVDIETGTWGEAEYLRFLDLDLLMPSVAYFTCYMSDTERCEFAKKLGTPCNLKGRSSDDNSASAG